MSEADKGKVREQMTRLLESHQFKNSRRYPALLRFIVEETLEGRGEFLKERLLGVRVFERPADYDTAADPIVRVTIAEIRKRIAQYYHDEEHDAEIRIELLPGHYVPEFRPRRDGVQERVAPVAEAALVEVEAVPVEATPAAAVVAVPRRTSRRRRVLSLAVASALLLTLGYLVARWMLRPTALEEFWAPILATKRPVLFCLPTGAGNKSVMDGVPGVYGGGGQALPSQPGRTFLDYEALGENVVYSDMLATLNIVDVLVANRRDYRVRLHVATTLDDLRQGPSVLVGGMDNQWTMRALQPLRFHFAGSDADLYWIQDDKNPASRTWSLDLKQNYTAVTRDYAIIARIHNEQTGQPEMIVAGIGMSGTAAAGEFVSDAQRVAELRQKMGGRFGTKDFEVVLSTDVVNGMAGSPKIVAVETW